MFSKAFWSPERIALSELSPITMKRRPRRLPTMKSSMHPILFTLMTLIAAAELGLTAFLISAGSQLGTWASPRYQSLLILLCFEAAWTLLFTTGYILWVLDGAVHLLANVANSVIWLLLTAILWGTAAGVMHAARTGADCPDTLPMPGCRQSLTVEALGWTEFGLCLVTMLSTVLWLWTGRRSRDSRTVCTVCAAHPMRPHLSFGILHKHAPRNRPKELTPEQRHMYSSEKLMNFRTIAKICASRSPYVLGISDLASAELHIEIAEIGQFAEVAYSRLELAYVFEHLDMLSKPSFPLEVCDALSGTILVSSFLGRTAKVPAYVAYRPSTRQLIIAFAGTMTALHALYDVRFSKHKHPAGLGCMVHKGFWKLYKGCRVSAIEGIKKGLAEHDVVELVITGHSLGGALSSLLAFDLLVGTTFERLLPPNVGVKIVGFGSPRVGNTKLVQLWRDKIKAHSEKGRRIQEYLVKAYNDGVPSLPPAKFGYRHLTESPMYFYHERLFHVPPSESEHGTFDVNTEAAWAVPAHPRGGHNYYNGRDLEKISRRMDWVHEMMGDGTGWESKYIARVAKDERKWKKQSQNELHASHT
ncbi:hypothetical protein NM688_g3047 [Phlebia brevispora]|uniref:Uncharacterized protein n=1 Tax=Phlebia brevispora TaxID=194682 RepID=A0ACC1T7I8_9APHY|nr:hypothetical protein NM688_g3047 [Phlebia brevispora]